MLDNLSGDATFAEQARAVGLLGAMFHDLAALGYAPDDRRYDVLLTQVLGIFDAERSRQIPVDASMESTCSAIHSLCSTEIRSLVRRM